MTISPPAKVKIGRKCTNKVLASGIDTLDLAIDIKWKNENLFQYLEEMKTLAIQHNSEFPFKLPGLETYAVIQNYGRKGHQWIINSNDIDLTIGNWLEPETRTRPSALVHIKSEALWRLGPQHIIDSLKDFFFFNDAEHIKIKPSRVDLCLDMTFPRRLWNQNLSKLRVSKSRKAAPNLDNDKLEGISIGKGVISARLYDKPKEIKEKSKKYWMYDVWNIEIEVPEEIKIIRIEGQFRREAIKELGIDTIDQLFSSIDSLWGYFTKDWLKFQDKPGQHHTMRTTMPWWEVVQNSFLGTQNPRPLLRCQVINPKKKQLYAQTYGTLVSSLALEHEEQGLPLGIKVRNNDLMHCFDKNSEEIGKSDFEVEMDLLAKRAKHNRLKDKMHKTHIQRKLLGQPSNIKPEYYDGHKDE